MKPYGIKLGVNGRHQITVSTQEGPVWPDDGNSFWITRAPGSWRLFTWNQIGYFVPEESDIVQLCRECIEISRSAMYEAPREIVETFGLRELDRGEVEQVLTAMQNAD